MTRIPEYRRAVIDSVEGRKLAGVAIRYGAEAQLGKFRERIASTAFTDSIEKGEDILALLDHDPGKVLGRRSSGTLRLENGPDAMRFELDVPDTAAGRDTLALARRSDLGGMSFGMLVEDETREDGVRVVMQAKLFEISVISSWPAYAGGTVEARQRNGEQFLLAPHSNALPQPLAAEARREAVYASATHGAPRLAALRRFLETV